MKQQAKFLLPFLVFIFCIHTQKAFSQTPKPNNTIVSFWGGYSFTSVRFLGKTEQSQTQIFGIGLQKPIKNFFQDKPLWYTADLIPYIHFTYPKRDENNRVVSRRGFGVSPVGFALVNSSSRPLKAFVRTTGGMVFMESNFPTDNARKLNFTFDITLGANFTFNSYGMISFGYKFHHISNAETGTENPGLDSNFLFLKLSIL